MDIQPIDQCQLPAGKKRGRLVTWIVGILIALAVVPWGVEKSLSPAQLGRNEQAYLLLSVAVQQERFSVIKENAIVAHNQTDDPDLSKVAQFFKDYANISMQAGIDTIPEGGTFNGTLKMFLVGYQQPLSALLLTWDLLVITSKCDRIDTRYTPIIEAYKEKQQQAKLIGRIVFWCVLVGGGIGLLWVKKSSKTVD
jgi:hypothetical protein